MPSSVDSEEEDDIPLCVDQRREVNSARRPVPRLDFSSVLGSGGVPRDHAGHAVPNGHGRAFAIPPRNGFAHEPPRLPIFSKFCNGDGVADQEQVTPMLDRNGWGGRKVPPSCYEYDRKADDDHFFGLTPANEGSSGASRTGGSTREQWPVHRPYARNGTSPTMMTPGGPMTPGRSHRDCRSCHSICEDFDEEEEIYVDHRGKVQSQSVVGRPPPYRY